MAIPNTVQVGGIIAPGAVVDTYPVTDPKYGLGGLRTVNAYGDLASIPSQRLQEGMVVYVSGGATPAYYSYVNSNWVLFSNDTTVLTNSASWQSVYTSVNASSGSWDNAYNTATVYQTNSADYATINFTNNKFLPLSGGTIDNSSVKEIVLRVQGSYDKLAIGTANYTGGGVTLSSVNALENKLSNLNIVASAFSVKTADGRTTLILDKNGKLTLGDSNYFPYTLPEIDGVKNQILATDGTGTVYWRNPSVVISDVAAASGDWNSVYTTVKSLSDSWEESAEILPTVTNYLSTNNVLMLSATIMDSLSVGGTLYTSTTADSILKYSSNVGNGIGTSFNIIHNFNTKDIVVSVYDNNTNIQAYPIVTIMDFDTINLQFSFIPSNNAYKVIVLGTKPSNQIAAFGNVTNTIYALEKYQFKTTDFDVISGYYAVDTTSGPVRGTLPAVPNLGDTFSFIDTYQTWNTFNFILDRNGNDIESLSQDLSANINGFAFKLTWVGGPNGWRIY